MTSAPTNTPPKRPAGRLDDPPPPRPGAPTAPPASPPAPPPPPGRPAPASRPDSPPPGRPAPALRLRALRKVYTVHERGAGVAASLSSLVRRRTKEIAAVDGIDFDVQPGEVVGFLGPNGAGKTTTLKMLSGLLYPSSGEVDVLGHVPWRR